MRVDVIDDKAEQAGRNLLLEKVWRSRILSDKSSRERREGFKRSTFKEVQIDACVFPCAPQSLAHVAGGERERAKRTSDEVLKGVPHAEWREAVHKGDA